MSTQTTEWKSNQGQRAGALQLRFEELTKNEQLLVTFCAQEGRPTFTIKELAEGLNWTRMKGSETMSGRARGISRVRNTLRRLVRSQWLIHATEVGDGKYRLSKNGLDRLRRLNDELKKNPKAVTSTPAPTVAGKVEVVEAADEF
jgi:hypothetical protein